MTRPTFTPAQRTAVDRLADRTDAVTVEALLHEDGAATVTLTAGPDWDYRMFVCVIDRDGNVS